MRIKALLVILFILALSLMMVTPVAAAPAAYGDIWHHVAWGETLSSIGRRYNVRPWAIASANGIAIWIGAVVLDPKAPMGLSTIVDTKAFKIEGL